MDDNHIIDVAIHLAGALLAGSIIGIERTFNGRPAGFRTHALVCVASAVLVLTTRYQEHWVDEAVRETIRTDPTRMAQGIMTGIGFLGAGVIFRDGLTVRGLTTAASIWMTAAIGCLVGLGLLVPASFATAITLFTLSSFRVIESKVPSRHFVRCVVRCRRDTRLPEDALRQLVTRHHFSVASTNYHLVSSGDHFEYQLLIRTMDTRNVRRLSDALLAEPTIVEFQLTTMGT